MIRRQSRWPLLLVAAGLVLLVVALIQAPRRDGPQGNLEGAAVGGDFALVDEDGRPVSHRSFAGRWRLMYFGYTFCPDVCPVDLGHLARGLAQFETEWPERALKVQPLFVTVDPERDTPAVLKTFTAAFHPRLVGLTGTPEQVKATLATFRIHASRREGATPGAYLMDHTAALYLFDPEGRPVAFLAGPEATPEAVRDLLARFVR
ncbi:MAG: SCO family protein [Sphingomonadaceae bacterium]|uniref:SCO family protein n=1 Tax=Thermaurantiacus sp. TaxID=2820283 RepID=UPI00298EEB21|nr:SCO family protein [Thermaurantiacus sp.]MCS6987372.1 SCO family protein [Sphingomonadaceae bacterium]MDW8415290.1 SCO family protein [Thermaurantiacus sp.]